jgi:hypothetical protein
VDDSPAGTGLNDLVCIACSSILQKKLAGAMVASHSTKLPEIGHIMHRPLAADDLATCKRTCTTD